MQKIKQLYSTIYKTKKNHRASFYSKDLVQDFSSKKSFQSSLSLYVAVTYVKIRKAASVDFFPDLKNLTLRSFWANSVQRTQNNFMKKIQKNMGVRFS